MMDLNVSLGAAVLAGLLSFLSPCVLPLVPPYLCFITGASLDQLAAQDKVATRRTMLAALLFVLGFATVFVALGASASAVGQMLRDHKTLFATIAGLVIIAMGLHFLGVFKLGFLNRDARYRQDAPPASLIGAYVVGLAFAFGWTPCIGPVLGAILTVAASTESVGKGAVLLALYSAGLGIPFLLSALAIDRFLGFFRHFRSHLGTVEKVMGGLLVLAGLGFLTGAHEDFANWLNGFEIFRVIG